MKNLVIASFLLFGGALGAESIDYLDQDNFERILYTGRAVKIEVVVDKPRHKLEFLYCEQATKNQIDKKTVCKPVASRQVKFTELAQLTKPLLIELEATRKKLAAQDPWRGFFTGKQDLRALDEMISGIKEEGLQFWIIPRRKDKHSPRFGSQEWTDKVTRAMAAVLNRPPPAPMPEDKGVQMAFGPEALR